MATHLRIKFMARTRADQSPDLWLSLFSQQTPIYNNCEFIFDPDARHYDWLVVYEDLTFLSAQNRSNRIEPLNCARENTLFITTEPASIKVYGPQYLAQFGHVLSTQPAHILGHPNQIHKTPPLRWYYGRPMGNSAHATYKNIDTLRAEKPAHKPRIISTVCSDKRMSYAFEQRYDFSQHMQAELGDDFHWFGRGIRPIQDKSEAMDDFAYHVAVENHVAPHHWTEKITDCFLAFCLPFYHGDPNIFDHFPEDSLIPIDINNPKHSAEIIRQHIKDKTYEKALPAILSAREKTLTDYNLMYFITHIVTGRHQNGLEPNHNARILGRHIFRRHYPLRAMRDLSHRLRCNM